MSWLPDLWPLLPTIAVAALEIARLRRRRARRPDYKLIARLEHELLDAGKPPHALGDSLAKGALYRDTASGAFFAGTGEGYRVIVREGQRFHMYADGRVVLIRPKRPGRLRR